MCSVDSSLAVPQIVAPHRQKGIFRLSWFHCIWDRSQVELLAGCLVALSLLDLLTTYVLLQNFADCYEANPVANYFLNRWNILGMSLFKFALVAGVVAMCEIIERCRPRLGKLVLVFGCVAAASVVLQGVHILSQMTFPDYYFG